MANYADPEIIAHEVQHTFSGLGDEYDYAGVEHRFLAVIRDRR